MLLERKLIVDPSERGGFIRAPSGLLLPIATAQAQVKSMMRPTGVDLFCGCGGFSLGFIQAGFEVLAAVDFDPDAIITYMTNLCRYGEVRMHFVNESDRVRLERHLAKSYKQSGVKIEDGELVQDEKFHGAPVMVAGSGWIRSQPASVPGVRHIFIGDVLNLASERILDALHIEAGELDCVFGSPPCQGFSYAGRRDPKDARNNLVFEFARFVVEMRPKSMCFENVPGILGMTDADGVGIMDKLTRILEDGSFAGVDAFKKALEMQTGAVGVLRGRGKNGAKKKDALTRAAKKSPKQAKTPKQVEMFRVPAE